MHAFPESFFYTPAIDSFAIASSCHRKGELTPLRMPTYVVSDYRVLCIRAFRRVHDGILSNEARNGSVVKGSASYLGVCSILNQIRVARPRTMTTT